MIFIATPPTELEAHDQGEASRSQGVKRRVRRAQVRLRVAIPAGMVVIALAVGVLGYQTLIHLEPTIEQSLHNRLVVFFVSGVLAIVALAAAMGLAMAQSIMKPLSMLLDQIERLERGEAVDGLHVEEGTEIGELGARFNLMLTMLRERSRRQSRSIMEQFTGALLTLDEGRRIAAMNAAAGEMLGVNPRSLLDLPIEELLARLTVDADLGALIDRLHVHGESVTGREMMLIAADGQRRRISLSGSPQRDAEGRITGSVLNLRDLDEITAFHERIRQSEQLAAVSTFASGVAHEIRNPLASIKAFAQLLREKADDHEQKLRYADVIEAEVNRLDKIITELQAFTREVAGTQTSFESDRLVREALDLARHSVEEERPVPPIHEEIAGGLTIFGQKDRLRQALFHVIENAIEWASGRGEVWVRLAPGEGESVITVENTGSTIAPEDMGQIFTPFFSTKATGPGLGLAVARQIVNQHQGRIDAEAEPDRVRFILHLPPPPSRKRAK